ncbi:sensor histidine kinase [Paenibacillus sp. IHBB 3054]|uniref:sensor histidine kinase n=1 Tax=Paenibacillus sp. IHBB 3054 TaxID=3425689 RepID=UPI003F669731
MNYFYIVMFLSMWTMGVVLLVFNRKSNFWISLTLMTGGMASFAFSIHLTIVPFLLPRGWLTPTFSSFLYQLSVVAMTVYFYLFPFTACMGALWLGAVRTTKKKALISILLFIPAVLVGGHHLLKEPWASFDISHFRSWAGFYIVLSLVFYGIAFKREKEFYTRKNKKRVGVIFTLGTLFAFVTDFVGFRSLTMGEWSFELKSNGTWKYNVVVVLGLVAVIIFYLVKNGFMGIKLRIEREKRDLSMRALTMGVSILNHSIKNEIQKINYLTEKTEGYIHTGQTNKSLQSIEQIHSVTAHLLDMVGRIKDKADDIVLSETQVGVKDIFTAVLEPMQPLLESRSVRVAVMQEEDGELVCDTMHLKETLSNLVQNAVDAMDPEGGTLTLRTVSAKRYYIIEVTDNGCGIPKEQLGKIFEPFYTTKKNAYNHGLGLPYCVSVMRKHGGRLTLVNAETGRGTTVILHFPIQRFKISSELSVYTPSMPMSRSVNRF